LQDINGIKEECVQNYEPIAYELQDKWQKEVNHPGPAVNFLFVALVNAHCKGGVHY
jgi:transcriptional regulatory protein LevR